MKECKRTLAGLALLLTFLLAIPFAGNAQKKKSKKPKDKDEKLYEMISNEPESAKNLHISISPFFFDLSMFNGTMGADMAAYYNFMNKFAVHGSYQYGLYYDDGAQNSVTEYSGTSGAAASKQSPFRNLQLGGTFFFKTALKDYTEDVVVKSETKGSMTTNYYIPVPAKKLYLYGARIGFQSLKTSIGFGSSEGMEFVAIPKEGGATRIFTDGDYHTMMGMNVMNFGVSLAKITDLEIDVTGLGERDVKDNHETYLDILYAPVMVYADMIVKDQNFSGADKYIVANVNDSSTKSRWGIRIGYNTYSTSVAGFSYGIEGGLRPGPAASPADLIYMNLRLAFCLSAKL